MFFFATLSRYSASNYCITLKSTTSVLESRKFLLALYLPIFHACRAQWKIVRIVPCWLELHHVRLCSISRDVSSEYGCICLKVFWRACYFGLCFEGHYILKRLRQWAVSLMEYIVFVCFIWNSYPQALFLIFRINLNLILFSRAFDVWECDLSITCSISKSYFLTYQCQEMYNDMKLWLAVILFSFTF